MYLASILALMLVLPLASIGIEILLGSPGTFTVALHAKWFVFWMVGVRLLVAGLRQIVQPSDTAQHILGIQNPDAVLIVRELGIANTAIGCIGVASFRTKTQSVAMFSDLAAAIVLPMLCGWLYSS